MRLYPWLMLSCVLLSSCSNVARHGDTHESAARASRGNSDGTLNGLYAKVVLPRGFRQVLAPDEGPIFTDDAGRTLYLWSSPHGGFCRNEIDAITDNLGSLMQSLATSTPTCVSQWPLVLARPDSKPVGEWTVVTRPDGLSQWAYQGLPVHYSYKDRLPGDVNGATRTEQYSPFAVRPGYFVVAQPALIAPPGIKVTPRRAAGLVATTDNNLIIYSGVSPSSAKSDGEQSSQTVEPDPDKWIPLKASAMENPVGTWAVRAQSDGSKIWTYRNQPLYTYAGDHNPNDLAGYGVNNARPLILSPAPLAPAGVAVRRSLISPVFTDANGMTLYYFRCANINPAGKAAQSGSGTYCDNWNDDPAFSEVYCPARDRCAEMWRPLQAPQNTPALGGAWSLAVIPDPARYPLRWVPLDHASAKTEGAIKVWTYHGRPVYTATADQGSGELRGHYLWIFMTSQWVAVAAGP